MSVIDLTSILKIRKADWSSDGIRAINSIPDDVAARIITYALTCVMLEVRIGLGLISLDDDEDLIIFDQIDNIYEEAAGGCYFCSSRIDPNTQEYTPDVKVCPMCALKLANFTQALGIDPGRVFKGMQPRAVQKWRIKIRD